MNIEKYALLSQLLNSNRITRRQFLARGGAAGMALGLPTMLPGCGGSSQPDSSSTQRTLFFNLSHLGSVAGGHVLNIAGKRFPLTPVSDAPHVLALASQGNAFLNDANVSRQITHHVESVALPSDVVMLAYLTSMEDPEQGTWQMNMVHLVLPAQAHRRAYDTIRAGAGAGAFPQSAKRLRYGMPAASNARELMEENMLVDVSDHAQTLIGMHVELASLDPDTAAHVHGSYIASSPHTAILADQLASMGPATVQQAAGQPNPGGWATLVPLMNQRAQPPVPFKKSDGRLNVYRPDWSSEVDTGVAYALRAIRPLVANDPALGMDVSSVTRGQPLRPEESKGRLWSWHRGEAYRERSPLQQGAAAPSATISSIATEAGLALGTPTVSNAGGSVKVTLDNVNNWYLRWLGVWLRFRDRAGNLIPIASLPADTLDGRTGPSPLDRPFAMFAGMMPPVSVLAGIPIDPGTFAPVITLPANAASTDVLYAGLGLSGVQSGLGSDDEVLALIKPGMNMTVLINYVLVELFMALGTTPLPETTKVIVELVAEGLAIVIVDLVAEVNFNKASPGEVIKALVTDLALMLVTKGVNKLIDRFMEKVLPLVLAQQILDAMPLVGMIARSVADGLDLLEIAETSTEIFLSPPVYEFSIVLTRNVTVTIQPDPDAGAFPCRRDNQILYYKLNYQFDSGPSHVLPAVEFPALNSGARQLPVTLDGIPLGGKVSISLGIYVREAATPPGQNDWCVAQATSGLQANDDNLAPVLTLTNTKIPINAGTSYLHTRRTVLAPDGSRRWQADGNPPPYLPPPGDQQPGLGALRNITVRQLTDRHAGYVGYAWQAFSSGVPGCGTDQGQYDYLANLNTDRANAQQGYASSPCGLQSGAQLSYSLLSDDNLNLYLDPGQLYLRPIQLGSAPSFAGAGLAFGQLNLPSTALLLHPAGHVVSINQEHHLLETLRLPPGPLDEATAARTRRARVHAGPGSRPGLLNKPVAAVVSSDGVILVLEASDTNNRIQAFDLGGNPVPYFKNQPERSFLRLTATPDAIYLDIAVEFSGYLYVLSRDDAGTHRLDIYAALQNGTNPICTTFNLNAAAIAVDYWRTLYALNYQPLTLPGGALPALTEPSISQWNPPLSAQC